MLKMDEEKEKCSKNEHKDIDAIAFCKICKIYLCNKCLNFHQGLFENHKLNKLDNRELFSDICNEINHLNKLEFFCKNHNQLCCAACISKMEINGYGQHKECDVCIIQNIEEEKKNKLNENIKYLEDISKNFGNKIKDLQTIYNSIDKRKEELKLKIQNAFTKIRSILNEREKELLLEIDNEYNDLYCNEDLIKESQKLSKEIKLSLEKAKILNNEWNNNDTLSYVISNCINIENNITKINTFEDNMKKFERDKNKNIEFIIEDEHR